MSRSFKRTPIIKSGGPKHRRFAKRDANKKVRRSKNIPSGKAYRKLYCSWDIYDYVFHWSFEGWMRRKEREYLQYWNGGGYYWLSLKDPEKRMKWEREQYEKYNLPPDKKKEFIEWSKEWRRK